MFKDKYFKDNEQIVPEESTKRYIKSKLLAEETKQPRRFNYNAVLATALSLVLAVGVTFIAEKPADTNQQFENTVLLESVSYDSIYDTVKECMDSYKDNYYSYITDGAVVGNIFKGESNMGNPESFTPTDDLATGTNGDRGESSTTNNQVQGVDEADLVKNDSKYIYSIKDDTVVITDSNNGNPEVVTKKQVAENGENICGLFVNENRLAVLLNTYRYNNVYIRLVVLDITDKQNITEISDKKQDGYYSNARMIGNTVYILSNHSVVNDIERKDPATYVPLVDGATVPADSIYVIDEFKTANYLVISSINLESGEIIDNTAVLGGAENVYCNSEHLYFTFSKEESVEDGEKTTYKTKTNIVKMSFENSNIETVAIGIVQGRPLNQFSMDEFDNHLRIVTTIDEIVTVKRSQNTFIESSTTASKNAVYVLDKDLNQVGAIENLAEGERVYSVRFDGNIGYFVTFRQVDPLFTVDLSNPKEPKILSELKIPGFSEYLHPYGEGRLFGFGKSATELGSVTGLKISMFDVSDPSNVTELHLSSVPAEWSEASSDHKAIMVDPQKNIIAFLAADDYAKTRLFVYGYSEGNGFFKRAESYVDDSYHFGSRFVWINDHFYLVSRKGITVFNLNSFEKLSFLAF